MNFKQILVWCFNLNVCCHAIFIDHFVDTQAFLNILIPTVRSNNEQCRNYSRFYLEELQQLKLWATEMFDASSKFPTGILSGVSFDFGNFDECVDVSVQLPNNEILNGQHCMARFYIIPPNNTTIRRFTHQYYEDENVINASVWEKVLDFYNDRARTSRNDFYLTYCLPSVCGAEDLEATLKEIVDELNTISDFQINVSVNPKHCQTKQIIKFDTFDIIYMSIIGIFVGIILIATLYDCLLKLDEFKHYRPNYYILAFSVWTNLRSLAQESNRADGLECINGMKVISMFLIIMGHRIMFGIGAPILNSNFIESMYTHVEATALLNGPIIVDTFFNISGFLACYLMLEQFDKLQKGINVIFLYVHRFVRLTPAYAVVIGLYCTVLVKFGSGPLWNERMLTEQERCLNSWWANLLYINNYIQKDQLCMFQSWYLPCDMHFFLTAPLFVWLLKKRPKFGIIALIIIIIVSIITVFTVVFVNNEDGILLLYVKFLRNPVATDTFQNIYIPTHMRASPYYVGMLTGYIKYQMRKKSYKLSKYFIYFGWFICVCVIETTIYVAFIFYIPGNQYNPLTSALYASLHHFTFSLCISWMIIAISEGYGSWIEPILSWKPLALLSRITYTAFLCHGAIQLYTSAILRQPSYASVFNLVFYTTADIGLSYLAGLVLCMAFEAPIIRLEKLFTNGLKKKDMGQNNSVTFTKN